MDRRLSAALAVVGLAACQTPVVTPLADLTAYGQERCPAQCATLEQHSCPEALPTAGGLTCTESCIMLLERRIWTPSDVACVEQAGSVEAVRKCRVRCRPSPTADSK